MLFFKLLFVTLLIFILLAVIRTWQIEHSADQKIFVQGQSPNPAPEGLYKGSVPGHKVSWLGKKFDAVNHSGINIFDDRKGGQAERYSFVTAYGSGLRDKNLAVLKIDYNIQSNPFWLRAILDEIVQVGPNEYLGKVHVRIIPGLPFTFGYFKLAC